MISVKDLTKRYGGAAAVSGISFEVNRREVMGFLGPNGAGKTTTLRMLAGCMAPTSGTAVLAGCDITAANLELRRKIGYLAENNPLYEDMDVAESLEWTAQVRGLSGARRTRRIKAAVEACSIGEVLSRPIGLLSKGFRQRVGLASAILHDPEILLLDEPTSGLDPNQSREVRGLIQDLKEEKTVLISTHILPEVEAYCDRAVILNKGRIASIGTPAEIVRRGSPGSRIRFLLKAPLDPEAVKVEVLKIDGVDSAETSEEEGGLWVSASGPKEGPDLREGAFRLAVRKKWTLLEMRREEASLESVFRELTPEVSP